MENLCSRCHRTLAGEDCFCPGCGLPQLVYASPDQPSPAQAEPWSQVVRDAGSVEWRSALRAALVVAVPAGLLSSELSAVGGAAMIWTVAAAGWAVALYWRSQKPAWLTTGAGARIGLVTGLIAAWVAFVVSSGTMFVERCLLHQGGRIDGEWKTRVAMGQQLSQQLTTGMGQADPAQVKATQDIFQSWMLSPEGHAGMEAMRFAVGAGFLVFFAVLGGALGAWLLSRTRRSQY